MEDVKEVKPKNQFILFMSKLFWGLLIVGIFGGLFFLVKQDQEFGSSSNYLNLGNFESKIYKAIENDSDLETFQSLIKQERLIEYLNSERKANTGDFLLLSKGAANTERYKEITTEQILLRMKAFYISTKGNKEGDKFLINIDNLIKDYNYSNPFEILEAHQKYPLENIKIKTDTLYEIIEEDVNRIVEELDRKNDLVNEYLSKSRQSYRNSIIAMSISSLSLIIGIALNLRKRNLEK